MHPELSMRIAQLRHEELTNDLRFRHVADRVARRRRFFRWRRDRRLAAATARAALVVLPPPREERDPTGHGLVA
jgi:hypothetical protein